MHCNNEHNIYDNSQYSLIAGQRNVRFGKYSWQVLDVQNGKALLLTEDIIERRCYHNSYEWITWEGCGLRGYLNGVFLQTFDSSEQSRIASVTNTNSDNPWYNASGGKNTTDKIFLLSIDEMVKYFGDSGDLRARKGWYWDQEGKQYVLRDGKGYCINDQYNVARMAKFEEGKMWWWLRSPGDIGLRAASVTFDGYLDVTGDGLYFDGGVRPALWLNL